MVDNKIQDRFKGWNFSLGVTNQYASKAGDTNIIKHVQSEREGSLSELAKGIGNSGLGIGFGTSKVLQSLLETVAPPAKFLGFALARAVGGLISAATLGYSLYSAYQKDIASGKGDTLANTRKEVVVGTGSTLAGLAGGSISYLLVSSALGASAPLSAVIGLGAIGVIGTGLVTTKTREVLGRVYDNIVNT